MSKPPEWAWMLPTIAEEEDEPLVLLLWSDNE